MEPKTSLAAQMHDTRCLANFIGCGTKGRVRNVALEVCRFFRDPDPVVAARLIDSPPQDRLLARMSTALAETAGERDSRSALCNKAVKISFAPLSLSMLVFTAGSVFATLHNGTREAWYGLLAMGTGVGGLIAFGIYQAKRLKESCSLGLFPALVLSLNEIVEKSRDCAVQNKFNRN